MNKSESEKTLLRLNALHPKVIDLSLKRVFSLLESLDNPQKKLPPVIHIAGTNGKGSTLAFIKAGLETRGNTVHSYTSPHLCRFNERIKLKGLDIPDRLLSRYLKYCEEYNLGRKITLFEITTCAAFLAFSKVPADYTLVEVGLGGRLDATNVIENAALSIITPISIDHQQFLGDTIESIAIEKAGILKTDTPAIVGKQCDSVNDIIFQKAKKLEIPLSVYGKDWLSKKFKETLVYEDNDGEIIFPAPKLIGDHQFENAGIAITAFRKLNIHQQYAEKALLNVNWPARLQKLKSGPLICLLEKLPYTVEFWIDGGHNQAAAQALGSFLKTTFDGTSHLIFGMINSKDVIGFLSEVAYISKSVTCIKIPNENSSLTADEIYKEAYKINYNSFKANSLKLAIENIISRNIAKRNLRILACGSLYLSGQILRDHS